MLILDVIVLILLIVLVYFILWPTPLRNLYKKYFAAVVNYDEKRTNVIGEHTFRGKQYRVLECFAKTKNANTVLIWFHGGSFIQHKYENIVPFLVEVAKECDIDVITFDYPVLYEAKLNETLFFINEVLSKIFTTRQYKNIYYGGDSAGTYLALKTIEIEYNESLANSLRLRSGERCTPLNIIPNGFIGVCGFYDVTINNQFILMHLANHWLWQVPDLTNFKMCSTNIPALIITSNRDFLSSQSKKFVDKQPRGLITYRSFETPNTLHCFVANTTLPETQEAINDVKTFIEEQNGV